MNAPDRIFIADVQASEDSRNVAIDDVGIKGLRYPIAVAGRNGGVQHTVAEIDLGVSLGPEVKGTHMSRFVELVDAWKAPLDAGSLAALARAMTARLGADSGTIAMRFPFFIRKAAPVSGVESLLDYRASARVESGPGGTRVVLALVAPVTSLCPCSKEISDYGAHNQRSHVTIEAEVPDGAPAFGFEDLARIAEQGASCEIYGLLKRTDEKFVTERAYDNPKFVEDLVRDIALALSAHPAIGAYVVEAENFESIHNHSAYARIARRK